MKELEKYKEQLEMLNKTMHSSVVNLISDLELMHMQYKLELLSSVVKDLEVLSLQFKQLEYEHDTTRGLWVTDKPQVLTEGQKKVFWQLK